MLLYRLWFINFWFDSIQMRCCTKNQCIWKFWLSWILGDFQLVLENTSHRLPNSQLHELPQIVVDIYPLHLHLDRVWTNGNNNNNKHRLFAQLTHEIQIQTLPVAWLFTIAPKLGGWGILRLCQSVSGWMLLGEKSPSKITCCGIKYNIIWYDIIFTYHIRIYIYKYIYIYICILLWFPRSCICKISPDFVEKNRSQSLEIRSAWS